MDEVFRGLEWFFENLPGSLIIVLFVMYMLSWVVWPKRKCPRCKAVGARFWGNLARPCGRCKGSGLVNRII